MRSAVIVAVLGLLCSSIGCGTQGRVHRERALFLKNPEMGSFGYSGVFSGGAHYQFLASRDVQFGAFLKAEIPRTEQPCVVLAGLHYFAYSKNDRVGFEEVVRAIRPELLNSEVIHGYTDDLIILTLAEWIEFLRKRKTWADQPVQRAGTGARR